ncbi:MAG: 6-bladed beta-propeller [Bacteroidaceae bacterium]|nr:6-bladed beta-propeller [Bacteroidaceae bacterium]
MMRKSICFISALALVSSVGLLILASCGNHDKLSCPILDVSSPQEVTPSEVFSSVEVIPLTLPEGIYLSTVWGLYSIGDKFLVKDSKRDFVFLFSNDGQYISHSEKARGHGHGEYTNLLNFTYNPYSKLVEMTTPNNLIFYDTLFNYVKSVPLPSKWPKGREGGYFFGRIYDLSPSLHLLMPLQAPRKICVFDSETSKITKEIPFDEHLILGMSMQSKCFYPREDGTMLFFPPCISKCLYTFDTNTFSITPYLSLDFGGQGYDAEVLREMSEKDEETRADLQLEYKKGMPMTHLPIGEYLIIEVKHGKYIYDFQTFAVHVPTGQCMSIKQYQEKKPLLPQLIDACEDGVLAVVETTELESLLEPFDEKDVIMPSRGADPNGYVILKYRVK